MTRWSQWVVFPKNSLHKIIQFYYCRLYTSNPIASINGSFLTCLASCHHTSLKCKSPVGNENRVLSSALIICSVKSTDDKTATAKALKRGFIAAKNMCNIFWFQVLAVLKPTKSTCYLHFPWYFDNSSFNLPALVKLKKKDLSLVLRFLLDMLAMAGKWTPWQAPRNTLDNKMTLNAIKWSEKR